MRQISKTVARVVVAGSLAALASACATRPVPPVAPVSPIHQAPAAACALLPASESAPDTVTVALTEAVDPRHAPTPRTGSERLLFAQLYETLVRVDCTGEPYAGLARSWSVDTSGRRWSFTVRRGARFWDGTPVTARDIIASWQARERDSDAKRDSARTPLLAMLAADSVVAVDDSTLTLVFHDARREVPVVLASTRLAIARSTGYGEWPVGTGAYRVDASARASASAAIAGDTAALGAITVHATPAAHAPVLDFRVLSNADARDVLDGGADLLVTSAPAVLGYAATRPDLVSAPLPWEHTYVLLSPARGAGDVELGTGALADTAANAVDASFRAALARDAVRAEARAAEGPYWWEEAGVCGDEAGSTLLLDDTAGFSPAGVPGSPPLSPRIVYPRDDRVARDLADRLVALAAIAQDDGTRRATALASIIPSAGEASTGRDNAARLIATGLAPDAFAAALHAGRDAAYVFALPHRVLAPCAHRSVLAHRAPWLTSRAIVPLVDTRARLVARRTVGTVLVDWDGTPHIAAATPDTGASRP